MQTGRRQSKSTAKFLFELVEGEETKPVGPCGTCGAIRVGAVSALFAPNGGRRRREHRGLRPVWVGVGERRSCVCVRKWES